MTFNFKPKRKRTREVYPAITLSTMFSTDREEGREDHISRGSEPYNPSASSEKLNTPGESGAVICPSPSLILS